MNSNQIISGTFGRLWWDGELVASVKSFEAKVSLTYEDVDLNGDLGTHRKYMGYGIEGTAVLHKIDSMVARKIKDGITSGIMPTFSFVAKVDDPQAKGAERVEISGVTIDELMLMKFENKTITEEQVPYKASGFKYIDLI